jgi:hypothetical protein
MGALFAPIGISSAATTQGLTAFPSYINPITNEIEDIGNNPGIGQGMTEDLMKASPATLITDDEGSLFVTMRVGLVQESQGFSLELLGADGSVTEAVPYNIVAEQKDANTQDIQFKIPRLDSVLRVSLVSIPMGREVVGFVQFAPEGELIEIPTAEVEVDDETISIYENAGNDEVTGIDEEARGPLLMFLGAAVGAIALIGGFAAFSHFRKKNIE